MKTIQANSLVSTKNLPEDEWLKYRRMGIGGSDAAVAAGMSPWKGRYELYMDKVHDITHDFTAESKERMHWGNVLETPIAEEFARRHPEFKVERRNSIFQSKRFPFALCNVDRVIFDKKRDSWGVLEIKNTSHFSSKNPEWQETGIPFYYRLQVQHMLAVLELDWAYFAYLLGGNQYNEVYLERDQDMIDDLIKEESIFWHHVTSREEPPVDDFKGTTELLQNKFKAQKDKEIDLSDQKTLVENLRSAKALQTDAKSAEKLATKALDQAKNELRLALGNSEIAMYDGKRIATWKESTTRRFDQKGFAEAHDDLYESFKKDNFSRTLRLTKEI